MSQPELDVCRTRIAERVKKTWTLSKTLRFNILLTVALHCLEMWST